MRVAARFAPWVPSALPLVGTRLTAHRAVVPTTLRPGLLWRIGSVGGLFGGLLGIGGGSAIAPLLLLAGALRPAQVSGTTLASVLVISSVGSIAYGSLGHLNIGIALPIALGSVPGSIIGAMTARRLSMRLMVGLFLLLLPYFAIKEFWPGLIAPVLATNTVSLALLGFATGICSGLLGIGAASLVVPSLVAFFLLDHIVAQGIAMSVALADSFAGVATHARRKNIDYAALFYIAPPAVLTAVAGVVLSHHLPDVVLRNLFGAFMVAVWGVLLARWIKDTVRHRKETGSFFRPLPGGDNSLGSPVRRDSGLLGKSLRTGLLRRGREIGPSNQG